MTANEADVVTREVNGVEHHDAEVEARGDRSGHGHRCEKVFALSAIPSDFRCCPNDLWRAMHRRVQPHAAATLVARIDDRGKPAFGQRQRMESAASSLPDPADLRALNQLISSTSVAEAGMGAEIMSEIRQLEDKIWSRGRLQVIVLTGGPCAGKSTVMSDLKQCLDEHRILTFMMPEIATEMHKWSGGRMWEDFGEGPENPNSDRAWAELQVEMTRIQIAIEDSIRKLAQRSLARRRHQENPPRGAVLLLDRGVIDNKAYCSNEVWGIVLDMLGTTTARLRDRRYDHVLHLVTAANGAEAFYTHEQAGNGNVETSARTETVEEARDMDRRTMEAWHGTKSFHIIDNTGTFSDKREQVRDIVLNLVGVRPFSRNRSLRVCCAYLSKDQILEGASLDPQITWPTWVRVTATQLTHATCVQKRESAGEGVVYYSQELDKNGSVVRQYKLDAWEYRQKVKIAKEAAEAARSNWSAYESTEDVVFFTRCDRYLRCHCLARSDQDPLLVVEIDGADSSTSADPARSKRSALPDWLVPRPVPGLNVEDLNLA